VVVEVDSYESEPCVLDDSLNLPIALRKEPRATAGKPLERYGFEHVLQTMCPITRCQVGIEHSLLHYSLW
jgi:hypothetical protein